MCGLMTLSPSQNFCPNYSRYAVYKVQLGDGGEDIQINISEMPFYFILFFTHRITFSYAMYFLKSSVSSSHCLNTTVEEKCTSVH